MIVGIDTITMKALTKKGNIGGLQVFVMSIGSIAITLAIVLVILGAFAENSYSCPAGYGSFNLTSGLCYETANASNTTAELSGSTAVLSSFTTKLGTIPSWIGILIVVAMATLVLSYFYMKR